MKNRFLSSLIMCACFLSLWLPGASVLAKDAPPSIQLWAAPAPAATGTAPDEHAAAPTSVAFLHLATTDNIFGHVTIIDHPATNNNPAAQLFVTANYNPGGAEGFGVYNNHAVGVSYDSLLNRWTIFNQDLASMPVNVAFNVLVVLSGANVFMHQATAGNTTINLTSIENPLTNNKPNALLFVTPNYSAGPVYNPHPLHVYYNIAGKWVISNQNGSAMPVGVAFNVLVLEPGGDAFVHKSTASNSEFNVTDIDHPSTNRRPNRLVFLTQNWTPGGVTGASNPQHVGIWYDADLNKMSIFNQNNATTMPINAAFNVYAPIADTGAFVHRAVASNITGQITAIDHPLINDDPYAVIFVTPNWKPIGSVNGVYNNHNIGVYYEGGRWKVFNQDFGTILPGASFNVLVPGPGANMFVHRATAANIDFHTTSIDHPLTNNNPNARLLVTPNWKLGSDPGVYNNHPIGVYYASGRWRIFNQDFGDMPNNAAFNVMVLPAGSDSFVHTASAGNSNAQVTLINNQRTNNNAAALVFITANWNPGGTVSGVYNARPTGVFFDNPTNRWAIFNQDLADTPENASFNVYVVGSKLYAPLVRR